MNETINMNDILVCIILNYNDAILSEKAARSAAAFHQIDKVVIVDNCSTDQSLMKLESIRDEKITVIKTDRNGGYGYGNNFGVRHAVRNFHADYVLIANPDVEFSQDTVRRMKQVFRKKPKCAVVSSMQRMTDGKYRTSSWNIPTIWQAIFEGAPIYAKYRQVMNWYKKENRDLCDTNEITQKVDCVAGSLLIMDAGKFIEAGGYDEEFFLYMEETVLGTRMKNKGFETYICTDASYVHTHGKSISKRHNLSSRRKMLWVSKDLYLKKYKGVGRLMRHIGRMICEIGTIELIIFNWILSNSVRRVSDK